MGRTKRTGAKRRQRDADGQQYMPGTEPAGFDPELDRLGRRYAAEKAKQEAAKIQMESLKAATDARLRELGVDAYDVQGVTAKRRSKESIEIKVEPPAADDAAEGPAEETPAE